jgi:sugar phosphate isomerase/epimerase
MDLAFSTLFCLNERFEKALSLITMMGTKNVELVDTGLHTLNQSRVEWLLELKSSYDLNYALHAPFSDVNIASNDRFMRRAALKRHEASVKWASALRVKALVFHPGAFTAMEKFLRGKAWVNNLESIRSIYYFAENFGVEAMVENLPEPFPHIMKSVDEFERFYSESGINIKMALDVAHAEIRGETFDFLEKFGDKIGHIHVSDNFGSVDEHLKIGDGNINWGTVIESINKTSFSGWVVIESYGGIEEGIRTLSSLILDQ